MKNNNNNKIITTVSIVFAAMLTQGCASTVLSSVSESNRDVSGTYDGTWKAVVVSTSSIQSMGANWRVTCSDRTGEEYGPLIVENGVLQFGSYDSENVSSSGKFRLAVPLKERAAASNTSDSQLHNSGMKVILNGSLERESGKLTFGFAQFGYQGCTSKVKYEKA